MKHKLFLTILCSLILPIFSFGQQPVKKQTGIALNNNAALNKKLDSIFSSFNNKKSPGFAVTVIQNGRVITKKNYGMASIELHAPFTHNTVVRLPYSEGREFISIAAALMEQEGIISLDEKVSKYFSKLPVWSETVTIQDLLNHSSGFCDEWATLVLTQASMGNRLDVSQFLNFLYNQPDPQIEPGKGYMYSNSDFGLLRLILEKASGQNLSAYLNKKVFIPLGMTSTKMGTDKEEVIPEHAFSYKPDGAEKYLVWLGDKTSPGGNYYLLTSANDMEKWASIHADKNSFISKAIERLKQKARPIPVLKGINYVFGLKTRKIGANEIIAHQGVSGYSYLTQVPDAGLSVICVGNYFQPYNEMVNELVDYLLPQHDVARQPLQKFSSLPVPVKNAELQKYAGNYRWLNQTSFSSAMEKKIYSEIKVLGDSLYFVFSSDDMIRLNYVGNNIFKDPDYAVWVVFSKSHPDSLMQAAIHQQQGNPDISYLKKEDITKPTYTKEYLQKLTGRYYSKHLDFYWTILLNDEGRLVLKRPTIADKIIEPGYDEDFVLKIQFRYDDETDGWIHFYFNEVGDVTYLDVRHGRLMHHRFDKQ